MQGFVWLAALAAGLSALVDATAQDTNSGSRLATSKTSAAKSNVQPAGAEEPTSSAKQLRPAGQPLRVNNVPPALRQLLKDWENSSAKIKKLEGEHRRWEFDYVFNVVKLNKGMFYYEAPAKGRIDLKPDNTDAGLLQPKKHWENGEVLKFKRQPGPSERWYCDGQLITQVDDQQKQATRTIIPKQNQGANIIDGPLPFLFGMPAEKAVQRFDLTLKQLDEVNHKATLTAIPKWATDAANYQLAEINLDTKEFLPTAVRLIDPAGTKETTFEFTNLQKNAKNPVLKWIKGDPFKFDDKSYKIMTMAPVDERAENANGGGTGRVTPSNGTRPASSGSGKVTPAGGTRPASNDAGKTATPPASSKSKELTLAAPRVPSVVGLEWKKAKQILEVLGYKVSLKRGSVLNHQDQLNHVERQQPDAKTNLDEGETVTLWLFIADE